MNQKAGTNKPRSLDQLHLSPIPVGEMQGGKVALRNLIYRSISGFRPLELDLYLPAQVSDNSATPCIVWIHGGAFAMGSRSILPGFLVDANFFHTLTQAGFAVAAIDYRLSGEAQWPAQLDDVMAAVRWLKHRSAELGLDSSRFAVWGESAGGHLAVSAGIRGTTNFGNQDHPEQSAAVAAIVDWYGPTNFAQMDAQGGTISIMRHDAPESPESLLLGGPIQELPARVADADPCTHVHKGVPPVLIRHGLNDRLVPAGQSQLLFDALSKVGSEVDIKLLPGVDHVFDNHPEPNLLITEAINFLKDKLSTVK